MIALVSSPSAAAKGTPDAFFDALLRDDKVCTLNQAFAGLWRADDLARANARLRSAFDEAMGDETTLTPEVADKRFKWQMRTWVRIYYLFGRIHARFEGRLEPDIRDRIEELFWNYGLAKSSLARATLDYIWLIQGSENHDLMDLGNAFLAIQAIAQHPKYAERRLTDDGTLIKHAKAWSVYFQHYCEERMRNGLFIEVASPTYGKYLIPELVNIADFADDPMLREAAINLLHLTWADWAIEQLDGVRGGAKSRCYQGAYSRKGHADSWRQMGQYLVTEGNWTQTGISRHPIHGFNLCLASSSYELPKVVCELARNPQARGEYAYVSRRPAKMKAIDALPPLGGQSCWYSMDSTDSRLVRYTWCTPDYIMGSFFSDPAMREDYVVLPNKPKRAARRYAAIHGQNRWQGIVFATGSDARIFPQCESTPDKKKPDVSTTYVQQVAVQHENVMLVQMNRANPLNKAMRIYFAPGMQNRLVIKDGWYIIEEGNAFAAVKLLSRRDGQVIEAADWDRHGFLRPKDPYAPIILVTGRKERFGNMEPFVDHLARQSCDVNQGKLTYRFIDTHQRSIELGLFLEEPRIPTKNGEPIDLAPVRVYESPFLMSDPTRTSVKIAFAGEELSIDTTSGERGRGVRP